MESTAWRIDETVAIAFEILRLDPSLRANRSRNLQLVDDQHDYRLQVAE